MPFFSIILPTFNRAHTIQKTIYSILNQTFTDWELIIVDDGSKDNTKEVIEIYKDSRIKYIWQENQERSAARNHGIRLAKGEWICFQDSDDEYLPEHLQILYEAIELNPQYYVIRTLLKTLNTKEKYVQNESKNNYFNPFPFSQFTMAAFHKSVFEKIQFNEKLYSGEDFNFYIKVGISYEIKVINKVTGIYNIDINTRNIFSNNYEAILLNKKSAYEDILTWNRSLKLFYIKSRLCLVEILILLGHIKYRPSKIVNSICKNFKVLKKYPVIYTMLIIRILYVKFGEIFDLYSTPDRF